MKHIKGYSVNIFALTDGEHSFDFQINKAFLAHFDTPLVDDIDVNVNLQLVKLPTLLELEIQSKGTVPAICDLCAEEFDLEIKGEEKLVVKFVDVIPENADPTEVIYLQSGEHHLELAETLYEAVMLSIPIQKRHPLDENGQPTCDPDTLAYLNKETNDEAEESESINPIWNELKKLKNKK